MLMSPFISQKMGMMLAEIRQDDLTKMSELMQAGKVTPVIDRTYPLSQIREAMKYLEAGHARGKVILTVEQENKT
jgi:NADPH:quinone reductase-like Zn-dependent oxidoreductase